jgi:hypothetical protein
MILSKKEQITRDRARFSEILWDMFTGDKKYKAILKNALHPYLVYSIVKQFFITLATSLFKGKSALNFPTSKFNKRLDKEKHPPGPV